MLKRFFVLTLLLGMSISGSGMLVGCGQTGPLYLPAQSNEPAEEPLEAVETENVETENVEKKNVEKESVDAELGQPPKETKDGTPAAD